MFTALRNASAGPSRLPLSARPLLSSRVPIKPLRIAGPIQPQKQLSAASISVQARAFSGSAPAADKLKSHSGTKKRFFRTGGGLVRSFSPLLEEPVRSLRLHHHTAWWETRPGPVSHRTGASEEHNERRRRDKLTCQFKRVCLFHSPRQLSPSSLHPLADTVP